MRKMIAGLLAAVMLLSLSGCRGYELVENLPEHETTMTESTATSKANSSPEGDPDHGAQTPVRETPGLSKGILALYTGGSYSDGYNAVLAWIDPLTGDMSLLSQFQGSHNITISPLIRGKTNPCPFSGEYGKAYLRQAFDSEFKRVVARNNEANSLGWMDTDGNYMDITGLLPADSSIVRINQAIGFYNDSYYFASLEIPADLYDQYNSQTSETHAEAVQKLSLIGEIEKAYELKVYKTPIQDPSASSLQSVEVCINGGESAIWEDYILGNTLLIQGDGATEKAFIYRGGTYGSNATPVFYSGLSGNCISMDFYGDWVDENTTIVSNGKVIFWGEAMDLNGEDAWEVRRTSGFPQKGERLSMEESETALVNPIVSPDGLSFACIEDAYEFTAEIISLDLFDDEPNQTITYTSSNPGSRICIFSLDSENMSAEKILMLDVGTVSISGNTLKLKRILDWTT